MGVKRFNAATVEFLSWVVYALQNPIVNSPDSGEFSVSVAHFLLLGINVQQLAVWMSKSLLVPTLIGVASVRWRSST